MLLIEGKKIFVKDYVEIIIMDSQYFKIRMPDYYLNIHGENLEIYYYDQDEIRLNGFVKVIEYDEHRV